MQFQLPRDFPALLLALRDLSESGEDISPMTVAAQLPGRDALAPKEQVALESYVSLALYALSRLPLLHSDRQGGCCPKCSRFTPFSNERFREQFLAQQPRLTCPACGRSSSRTTWSWPSDYRLLSLDPKSLPGHLDSFPLSYRVQLPDRSARRIADKDAFCRAAEDAARWYLDLPTQELEMTLEGTDEDEELFRRVGAKVFVALCPDNDRDYAALSLIDGSLWDTFYALTDADEEQEPTPRHVFDCTLRESIIAHLEAHWDELLAQRKAKRRSSGQKRKGKSTMASSVSEEHGKRAWCPGQETNLAHFMRYVVQTDQDDLNDDQQIDRFTSGLFTVWWTSLHSSDGHVVSDEFDLFCQGKKLDAHEQMQGGGILDMDGVRRIAARIAPGQAPDAIIGTVS